MLLPRGGRKEHAIWFYSVFLCTFVHIKTWHKSTSHVMKTCFFSSSVHQLHTATAVFFDSCHDSHWTSRLASTGGFIDRADGSYGGQGVVHAFYSRVLRQTRIWIAVATPSPAVDGWVSECHDIRAIANDSAAAARHGWDRAATSSGLGGASRVPQVQPWRAASGIPGITSSLRATNGPRAGTMDRVFRKLPSASWLGRCWHFDAYAPPCRDDACVEDR